MNWNISRKNKYTKGVEDDFWRQSYQGEGVAVDGTEEYLGKRISDTGLSVLFILLICGLGILFGKAAYLQAYRGEYYHQLSERNRLRIVPLKSSRGIIYDSHERPLVHNIPIFDATIIPKELPLDTTERDITIRKIAALLDIQESSMYEALSGKPVFFAEPITVKENIDYETALMLTIKSANVPGLYIDTRTKREYIAPYAFSHIIGYEGTINEQELDSAKIDYLYNDRIGKTGLEKWYEKELRGTYGEEVQEVNVRGVPLQTISKETPVNGINLVLGIDMDVQNKVADILREHLDRIQRKRASVVLMDPHSGTIHALVSYPAFDNNLFADGISQADYQALIQNEDHPLFNRSIKGEYPSGSTIKTLVGAAALTEGIATPQTTFLSTGGISVYDRWFFPDWQAGGHGLTNIYRAIAWSVNTYFYIIGGGYQDFEGLGVDRLAHWFREAGLGKRTGIDLPGEANGLVPTPEWKEEKKGEQWYIGDTYHMAIGQGDVLVTPLQVAQYTSIFANGGKLLTPHIVDSFISPEGEKIPYTPEVQKEQVFPQQHVTTIKEAMRQTVTEGSAQLMSLLPVSSAGKTGTAQWHPNKDNHAWYAGFAPYENPELVISVLVEEGDEGSAVAVPIAYDIFNWYFGEYKNKIR